MNLLVDPIFFIPPNKEEITPEKFCDFLENILEWEPEIRSSKTHEIFTFERFVDLLYDVNYFPVDINFQHLWGTFRNSECDLVEVLDYNTVSRVFNAVIETMPYLEDRIGITTGTICFTKILVNPDFITRLPTIVGEAFREALGRLCYARGVSENELALSILLLTRTGDLKLQEPTKIVEVEAEIQDIDNLISEIPIVEKQLDLVRLMGLATCWENTSQALAWASEELKKNRYEFRFQTMLPYVVAPDFNDSISGNNHFDDRVDLLASIFWGIAKLLYGISIDRHQNHLLRDVPNHIDLQQRIWEPWRLWITRGNPTLRLHYWKLQGERKYIFSRVVVHENYTIGPIPNDLPI